MSNILARIISSKDGSFCHINAILLVKVQLSGQDVSPYTKACAIGPFFISFYSMISKINYVDYQKLNFGERLVWLRKLSKKTQRTVASELKVMADLDGEEDDSRSKSSLSSWENSEKVQGSSQAMAWLAIIYQDRDTGFPANLNWILNDVGLPYATNLSEREHNFVKRFRDISCDMQNVTFGVVDQVAVDVDKASRLH